MDRDFALSPDCLTSDSYPVTGFQIGEESGEFAFVFRVSDEAAEGMGLAGPGTPADGLLRSDFATNHSHGGGGPSIGWDRSGSIQSAQGADALAQPGEQDREFRAP